MKDHMGTELAGKAKDKSKTAMSEVTNDGPGQGKYKAGIGDPMDLGLSSQMKLKGGSAGKLRQVTNEAEQRPMCSKETINADRGKFTYIVD